MKKLSILDFAGVKSWDDLKKCFVPMGLLYLEHKNGR